MEASPPGDLPAATSRERGGRRYPVMSLPPFEQVVTEHGALVLRVCRAVVGPHDAEDVWSETFLAALGAYPRLRRDSNIRGWLVTIAHRKAIDWVRARARAPLPVDPPPDRPAPGEGPADPEAELWQAVAALPAKQRAAVAYHYVADLPYAEVAALIGGSEVAARRSAADGIASLRKTLGGRPGHDRF